MISRRHLLGAAAAGSLFSARSRGARPAIDYEELEARIARRDFANLYKEDLPTPCMIVDLETLEKNLRTMAAQCKRTGVDLRGHVKVHKSPDIAHRQMKLGAIGVTCATVAQFRLSSESWIWTASAAPVWLKTQRTPVTSRVPPRST